MFESATDSASGRIDGDASRYSGVSSSVTPLSTGVQMKEMLCAMKRRAVDAFAASTRLRVPSVRTRMVSASGSTPVAPKAVSW